jgi:hypothetical protein
MFTPRDIYCVHSLAILDVDLHIGIPEQPFHNGCLPTTERCDLDCRRCCGPPDGLVGWCDYLQAPVACGQRQCGFLLVGLRVNVRLFSAGEQPHGHIRVACNDGG